MIPVPEQVLAALANCFGVVSQELTFLGGGREDSDGIVYSYTQGGRQRVLKVLAVPAADTNQLALIQERLKFVHFLGEQGADIVYPFPMADGKLLAIQPSGDHLFVAYGMDKVNGHHPQPDEWTDPFYQAWGKAVGRLHRLTQLYPASSYSAEDMIPLKSILSWEQEWQSFYNWCRDPQAKQAWVSIRETLEKLPDDQNCFGFVHNDPHINNLLFDGERIVLIDFDVANYHWFISDIAIAMQGLLFSITGGIERPVTDRAPLRHFLDEFMQGYETENHLDRAWLERIDLFISYRRLLLFTVMQDWLETQPDLRAGWLQMILEHPPVVNG